MDPVDGNALGGALFEWYGQDMTARRARCAHCGAAALLAEVDVYEHAPGMVARCRSCAGVLLVVTQTRTGLRLYSHLELVDLGGDGS